MLPVPQSMDAFGPRDTPPDLPDPEAVEAGPAAGPLATGGTAGAPLPLGPEDPPPRPVLLPPPVAAGIPLKVTPGAEPDPPPDVPPDEGGAACARTGGPLSSSARDCLNI